MESVLALIPLFPLIGFAINGLFSPWIKRSLSGVIACVTVFCSFIFSSIAFYKLVTLPAAHRLVEVTVWRWIDAGSFHIDIGFQLDPLSAVMIMVVSGVGFLIHVYSIGYMSEEPSFARYFAYLNLFTFAMLLLVLGNNFLLMFVGWEGVGLCSYLLIGFWYEKRTASDAGKKAFIVNRIGDFGFIIGMITIFAVFGSLDFTQVFSSIPAHLDMLLKTPFASISVVTMITLFLFVGATGKSAQIPLYVWLPDAMEGPTPVSALIHAATMVTAGVYMVARCSALYLLSGTSLMVVAIVGALTAFFAATIGVMQNDIKRVLAYSTVSQLGYMFLACGVGAFSAGIFHLMTHAFFKALLFLGAGSVIHAMSGEQDIRKMGGLAGKIPVTYWVFLIATLAISGVPGFSGFFSKDEILWFAYSGLWKGNLGWVLWALGAITAAITAFYMFRLVILTFLGTNRADEETWHHVHESPKVMLIPLVVLAVLAVIGGYVGMPGETLGGVFGLDNYFHEWLAPVFQEHQLLQETGHTATHASIDSAGSETATTAHATSPGAEHHQAHSASVEWLFMLLSVLLAASGIGVAFLFYKIKPQLPEKMATTLPRLYHFILDKYRVDELYDFLVVQPIKKTSEVFLWRFFDAGIIDGAVNGVGQVTRFGGSLIRKLQNGVVHRYAVSMVIGFIALMVYLLSLGD